MAFDSSATNLVPDDYNNTNDIFVHDWDADQDQICDEPGQISTVRVSVSRSGTSGNKASQAALISADGRYVAFASSADNLVSGDNNNFRDIFLHDRDFDGDGIFDQPGGRNTTLLSHAYNGTGANDQSDSPTISAEGGTVVFESYALPT